MIVAGSAGLAASAAPTDVSEGWGKFLGGSVGATNLDEIVELEGALAATPSGDPSADEALTLAVLQALSVSLPSIDLLGENGILQLGAAEQLAIANANGDAYAGSGAVSESSGAIAIDDEPGEDLANASLDLSSLAEDAGLDDIIGELRLEIGALASRAEQVDGAVDSEYLIADLSLDVESLAVANLYGTLNSTVGTLQTTLDGLAASLNTALSINILGLAATANVALTPPDLTALLPTGPLGDGAVTVDLTNGQITVDIEQILTEHSQNLNGLDPNTELLTPEVLGWIVDEITETVTDIVQDVLDGVVAAVEGTALTGTVSLTVPLAGTLVLNVGGTILAPIVTVGTSGDLLGLIVTALGLAGITLDGLAATVTGLLTGALSGVLGTLSTFETTVNGIVDSLGVDLIAPLLTGLDGLVNLTANVQPTTPPVGVEPTGDLPLGSGGDPSFTVRALQITLLGAGDDPLAQVNLASSTVRGTDADADSDGTDGTDTEGTDTDAASETDADVDVDATDAGANSNLASTGSGLDSLWLIGFGALLLLAGAATLLVRRRNV